MATLPHPASDGERADGPLSDRERAILDDIAGHENAGDPGFVGRIRARPPRSSSREAPEAPAAPGAPGAPGALSPAREALARARVRDLTIQAAVVVALAALLLPASWFVAGVLTLVLLVVPTLLLAALWRTDVAPRRRRADGP